MFSRVDKKILLILILAVIIILLASFLVYQYMVGPIVKVQNLTGGAQTETKTQ